MAVPRFASVRSLPARSFRRLRAVSALLVGVLAVACAIVANRDHGPTIAPKDPDTLKRELDRRLQGHNRGDYNDE